MMQPQKTNHFKRYYIGLGYVGKSSIRIPFIFYIQLK